MYSVYMSLISERDRFTGIQNIARIECALQRLHELDGFAMFGDQRLELVHADTVLARARSAHRTRALTDLLRERLGFLPLGGIFRIKQHDEMEIAIADIPDDWRGQTDLFDVGARFEHAFGQA